MRNAVLRCVFVQPKKQRFMHDTGASICDARRRALLLCSHDAGRRALCTVKVRSLDSHLTWQAMQSIEQAQ